MAASRRKVDGEHSRKRRKRDKESAGAEIVDQDLGTPLQSTDETTHKSQLLSLHRARFVDWDPTAVTAMSASGDGTMLAVARDSGVLELWETEHWTCLTVSRACWSGLASRY